VLTESIKEIIPKTKVVFPLRGIFLLTGYLGLFGAVEKTRTSTGFRPQRPQRCASTNSATTA